MKDDSFKTVLETIDSDMAGFDEKILKIDNVIQQGIEAKTFYEREKEKLYNVRSYLIERYAKTGEVKKAVDLFGGTGAISDTAKRGREYGETTKFIKEYIRSKGTVSTKDIMATYASHVGQTASEVSKNVSRTLGRLKEAGTVNNPGKDGSQRGGRIWYYTENQ